MVFADNHLLATQGFCMPYDTTKQSVLFENVSKKAVTVKFDQDHASSDGGAVLLKACDQKLKLSATLASCLSDDRQQSKVTHSLEELFRQRLFAIACGYAGKHQKVWGNQAAHGSTSTDLAPAFSRISLLELLRSVPPRVRAGLAA